MAYHFPTGKKKFLFSCPDLDNKTDFSQKSPPLFNRLLQNPLYFDREFCRKLSEKKAVRTTARPSALFEKYGMEERISFAIYQS